MAVGHYVYVIGGEVGPVKIGTTVDPDARLAQLRSTSASTLVPDEVNRDALALLYVTEGDRWLESRLHHVFGPARVAGEWFNLGVPKIAVRHVQDQVRKLNRPLPTAGDPRPSRRQRREQRQAVGRAQVAHLTDLIEMLHQQLKDPAKREGLRDLFPEVFCKCPGCTMRG